MTIFYIMYMSSPNTISVTIRTIPKLTYLEIFLPASTNHVLHKNWVTQFFSTKQGLHVRGKFTFTPDQIHYSWEFINMILANCENLSQYDRQRLLYMAVMTSTVYSKISKNLISNVITVWPLHCRRPLPVTLILKYCKRWLCGLSIIKQFTHSLSKWNT